MANEKVRDHNLHMLKILSSIFGAIDTLITGGKFGSSVPSEHSYRPSKWQQRRQKEFVQFGSHSCKICNTKIPGNMPHCTSCYFKYIKK
jgi:hypothetical protein